MRDRAPHFSKTDAQEAAEWILRRRQGTHAPDGGRWRDQDPDLERFPDPEDLLAVVQYVGTHQRVPPEVLRDDALAVLVILDYLDGELQRRRLGALRLARAPDLGRPLRTTGRRTEHGVTWRGLSAALRVGSAQGAEQLYLRLVNAFEGKDALGKQHGMRDERQARAARQAKASSQDEQRSRAGAVRAFVSLVLKESAGLPSDLLERLEYHADELDPRQRDKPLSRALEADATMAVKELLALILDGRLRAAVDHIAPTLGVDVSQQLRLMRATKDVPG